MTAILGVTRFQSFLRDNVTFNAGGTVEAYIAGTTPSPSNRKNIYATVLDAQANTNPIANPFTLDSAGSGNIVCQGATLIIVKDKDGNILSTTDYIDAATNNVIDANGRTIVDYGSSPNAVNYVTITNAAAGQSPSIRADGSTANINLSLAGKGLSGGVVISGVRFPAAMLGPAYSTMRVGAVSNTLELTRDITGFLVEPSITQNVASGATVNVAFGAEIVDRGNNFAANVYTVPITGIYNFSCTLNIASFPVGGVGYLHLRRNGGVYRYVAISSASAAETSVTFTCSCVSVTAGDTIGFSFSQTNGSSATAIIQTSSFASGCLLERGP